MINIIITFVNTVNILSERFGRMVFATNKSGAPLTIDDLGFFANRYYVTLKLIISYNFLNILIFFDYQNLYLLQCYYIVIVFFCCLLRCNWSTCGVNERCNKTEFNANS